MDASILLLESWRLVAHFAQMVGDFRDLVAHFGEMVAQSDTFVGNSAKMATHCPKTHKKTPRPPD
ncbi:hypothetical protein [Sporosarcina beigongshangi]|uniref:hypothetical protein n=1 Tax=Sporosarcina beigongshangi TaxID=2782538 RepID=UPI002ACE597D|nr:hypothetical protein [Sporosarcina beigongshangi]